MEENKFNFGDLVKDTFLNKKAIVVCKTWLMSGCFRYEVQYENDLSKSSYYCFVDDLKLIKKSTDKYVSHKPFIFNLGDIVKSIITGNKFVVTSTCQYRTGFNRYYAYSVKTGEYNSFEENEIVKSTYWFKSNVLDSKQVKKQTESMNDSPSLKPPMEKK
jgi:hypothetical protein